MSDRPVHLPAYNFRAEPNLISRARVGLMLPAGSSVSEVVRAALELAAGAETPDGKVNKGGWRPRKDGRKVWVDPSTMRVRGGEDI